MVNAKKYKAATMMAAPKIIKKDHQIRNVSQIHYLSNY